MELQGVYHRSLNMSNLLVEPQPSGPAVVKVSDFTYSKNALLDSKPKTMIGDFAYTCPELLLGMRSDGNDTGRCVSRQGHACCAGFPSCMDTCLICPIRQHCPSSSRHGSCLVLVAKGLEQWTLAAVNEHLQL